MFFITFHIRSSILTIEEVVIVIFMVCDALLLVQVPGHRVNSFRRTCVGYRTGPASCFASASSASSSSSSSSSSGWTSTSPQAMRRLSIEETDNDDAARQLLPVGGGARQLRNSTAGGAMVAGRRPKERHHGGPNGVETVEGRGRARKPRDTNELFDLTTPTVAKEAEAEGKSLKSASSSSSGSDGSSKGGGFIRAQDRRSQRFGSDYKPPLPPSGASQIATKAAVQAAIAAGTDAGPRPHDGRGCYQCAARMQQVYYSAKPY